MLKRRYANNALGNYTQKRVDEEYFKGYVCNLKFKNVEKPSIVNNGIKEFCIRDNDYEWFEVYPDNGNYVITIMFDNNSNLIEWYFDVAKKVGLENGIPYEDDLYLDMTITPEGKKIILDEDELLEALNKGEITKEDVEFAYKILKEIESMYASNVPYLIELTNKFCELFESKMKVELTLK